MVLAAATKESDDSDTIAALPDKIGEVATPTVHCVETPPLLPEVEQLHSQNIDTGSEVSVTLPTKSDGHHRSLNFTLEATNGTQIHTYGQQSLTLNLHLHRPYRWIFTIADVKKPILGVDFLQNHVLLIDIRGKTQNLKQIFKLSCNAHTRMQSVLLLTLSSSLTLFYLLFGYPEIT
uniref:Uncharacterized protein n=1 Tax=Amphimedon queenslandica TaxID=400682 RepID=A0A1X7U2J7_AMPQE